jgi:hypothetical protein
MEVGARYIKCDSCEKTFSTEVKTIMLGL